MHVQTPVHQPPQQFSPPAQFQQNYAPAQVNNEGKSAIAIFEYDAAEENEVTFVTGDMLVEIDMVSEDWWAGKNSRTGQYGINLFLL
jgi:drebrin-like protein